MSLDQFDDSFENFDIEDFDEDFDEDFEAEIEGEYELTNNEYLDFDDPSLIPAVDFSGERDEDEEEEEAVPAEEGEACEAEAEAEEEPKAGKSGKKANK
jgi:hypothetical protein